MMLYTFALVLVHAVLAVQGGKLFHKTHLVTEIEALCADKNMELLCIAQLEHANMLIGKSSCSNSVKSAVPDLLALIEETKDDSCAQESIDKLRGFYAKYLDTSSEENKKREQLPKSLRRLALAYGMQMSSACKRRMVDVLTEGDGEILQENKYFTIRNLVGIGSPVADMLEGLVGPDEILLPGDLAPYIKARQAKGAATQEDDTIYVQSATAPYIRKLQTQCTQVFAPIYNPLIRPIVQLANMGFNYKDEPLRCDMGCTRKSRDLASWSRLVFFCESLNNIHMIDANKANDADGQTVRILTKEEAAAIESASEPQAPVAERVYAPAGLRDGLIIDEDDKQLKKAIKAFSTSKNEEEKAAKRMMNKGISLLKTQLKRHKFGLLLSAGVKALVHRGKSGENFKARDEIVRVLEGAVSHEDEFRGDSSTNQQLEAKWDVVKEIANDIGSTLAAAVVPIMYVALVAFCVGVLVLNFLIFTGVVG